jgi:ribosomal-protein-alanine N-acetyltransferase
MTDILYYPEIDGDRVRLLKLNEAFVPDMWEYSRLPEFFDHLEFSCDESYDDTLKYFERLAQRSNQKNALWWHIFHKSSGHAIGTIGFHDFDLRRQSCEISYGISPKFWKKGYFSEALGLLLAHLFDVVKLNRVYATTSEKNIDSISALTKNGFVREGVLRDFYKTNEGDFLNAVVLSLLSYEYRS